MNIDVSFGELRTIFVNLELARRTENWDMCDRAIDRLANFLIDKRI
jgi:hypothetical protein